LPARIRPLQVGDLRLLALFFMLSTGEKSTPEYIASKRALQDQAPVDLCGLTLVRIDILLQHKGKEGRAAIVKLAQQSRWSS
jgi:hypothetical protein